MLVFNGRYIARIEMAKRTMSFTCPSVAISVTGILIKANSLCLGKIQTAAPQPSVLFWMAGQQKFDEYFDSVYLQSEIFSNAGSSND